MGTILGLVMGVGVLCVYSAFWERRPQTRRPDGWRERTRDRLVQAGFPHATPANLIAVSAGVGGLVWLLTTGLTRSPAIGFALSALAARAPFGIVASRASKRRAVMREVWPEAVENLASAIRAGLSLPEALGQMGERGPRQLRPDFAAFAQDFRATGRFDDCLDALKARLADPVADRIVESLRVTREVGGSDLGRVLRTLGGFLREDARTRGELEARQSWTVNAARIAVVAPWAVLMLLATRPETADAYNSPAGISVLGVGAASTIFAYRLMARVGRLPLEQRVMR